MFYNKKYLFFLVLATMNGSSYSFIYSFLTLTNIKINFLLGFLAFYGSIIIFSFFISLVLFIVCKNIYKLILFLFKRKNKNLKVKILWHHFTYIAYIVSFIVFIKITKY